MVKTVFVQTIYGKVFNFCQDESGKKWVECPDLTLCDDSDVEHISRVFSKAYSFMSGGTLDDI